MDEKEELILVPAERLSKQALHQLIDEYILREGTDYGHNEATLEQKHDRVAKGIQSGHLVIAFSTTEQTTTLMTENEIRPFLMK